MSDAPVYTIEVYRIDVSNNQFVKVDEITTFQGLSYFSRLNSYGSCSFNLNVYDPKATQETLSRYRHQIAVKRNGTIVWVGPIVKIVGNLEGVKGVVQIQAISYLQHLRARFTDTLVSYLSEDAGDIAWNLIDTIQSRTNGELMIREGNIEVSEDRDRTYERAGIAKLIVNLSNVINGFDFEFVPQQDASGLLEQINFNVYKSLSTTRNNYILNMDSLINLRWSTTGNLVNTVIFDGAGTGDSILTAEASDSSSQIGFTRREDRVASKDVSIQDNLQEKADEYIRVDKVNTYDIQCTVRPGITPSYGEIGLGDIVTYDFVTEDNSFVNFQGTARVLELIVSIDQNGAEKLIPALDIVQ